MREQEPRHSMWRALGVIAFALLLVGPSRPAQAQGAPGDGRGSESAQEAASQAGELQEGAVPSLVLALLPFRVHVPLSGSGLGGSFNQVVRDRLAAVEGVRLVPADDVAEALGGTPSADGAAVGDVALRGLAARLGAAAAISGSLTELAGRFSLDLRITPAERGRQARSIFFTAAGEQELLVELSDIARRVTASISGASERLVYAIEIVGAHPELQQELEALLTVRRGEAYDEGRVQDDRERLAAHAAVATVGLETERNSEGVMLRFRVVPGARIMVRRQAGPGAVVAVIEVRGNRRIESDAIRARIRTRVGEALSDAQLAADIRKIFGLGFFRDVRVRSEDTGEGLRLVFEVDESPVVRQVAIEGNDEIDGEDIREQLTLTTGSTLDFPLLKENVARITGLYRAEGYFLAEVGYRLETISPGSVSILFTVQENEKLRLRKIEFVGNRAFDDDELRDQFATTPWKFYSLATSWFDKTGTYSEPIFMRDLSEMRRRYTDSGYLQVEVGEPNVVADEKGLVVRVEIREGPQFRVGSVEVRGDETTDREGLEDKLMLVEGDVFNRSRLTADVEALEQHYTDRGFFFAQVQPGTFVNQEDQTVDVAFEVHKGSLYFVRTIEVSGNTTTIDPVIRREMRIVEGQLYSARAINTSRSRLGRLGFFEDVNFEPKTTDDPSLLDLDLSVVERPTGSFSFGAGFSSQDSFVLNAALAQANVFGRGFGVNLSADISTGGRSNRFFLSVVDPYFLDSTFSLNTTIFFTEIRFGDFQQRQQGVDFTFGHLVREDGTARVSLGYGFTQREIQQDNNIQTAAIVLRERLQGEESTSRIGLGFVSDTRDDRFSPTEGSFYSADLEFSGLGGFTRFLRLEGRYAHYFGAPDWLFDRSTFVFATRLGYTLPFNDISDFDFADSGLSDCAAPGACQGVAPLDQIDGDLRLPLSERFFLGGVGRYPLRGFRGRSLGPRRPLLRRVDPSSPNFFGQGDDFVPLGAKVVMNPLTGQFRATCDDENLANLGNGNGLCNDLGDRDISDFEDLQETTEIGGTSFISTSFEYRFPISTDVGLQAVLFMDMGNAFQEGDVLFDVTEWRYGYGGGLLWFSPFGPLQVVLGWPINPTEVEDSPVFEFSVGGAGL